MAKVNAQERWKARVIAVMATIPAGRVTTYGAIGRRLKRTPRQVAFVLARLSEEESATLPWFRVVAANGIISTMKLGIVGHRQIQCLQMEGVSVNAGHKIIDFKTVFWKP